MTVVAVGITTAVLNASARGGRGSSSPVSVRGYTRSDGTHVQAHVRSAPDGRFGNNWSTRGNVNPYTLESGTLTSPSVSSHAGVSFLPSTSSGYAVPSFGFQDINASPMTEATESLKETKISSLEQMGVSAEWNLLSVSQLIDMENRARMARNLQNAGIMVDWQKFSFASLREMKIKKEKADKFAEFGVTVDWTTNSIARLQDLEARILKANDLRQIGVNVGWQTNSWFDLFDIERRVRKAEAIKSNGVEVDWRSKSFNELVALQDQTERINSEAASNHHGSPR